MFLARVMYWIKRFYKFAKTHKRYIFFIFGVIFIFHWSYRKVYAFRFSIVLANDYPGVSERAFDNRFIGTGSDLVQEMLFGRNVAIGGDSLLNIRNLVQNGDYLAGCGFVIDKKDGLFYSNPIIKNVIMCEVVSHSRGSERLPWFENDIVIIPKVYYDQCYNKYKNIKWFDDIDSAVTYFKKERKATKLIIDNMVYIYYKNIFKYLEVNFIGEKFDLCMLCKNDFAKAFIDRMIDQNDICFDADEYFKKNVANN